MELIKIEQKNGIETVSARDLWEALESKQEFANWIKSRIEDFEAGLDYVIDKVINNPLGGRPTIDYYLTIDTAKHLAMLERNEAGKQIRQYFIEIEKKSKELSSPKIPQNYAEALRLAADQAELIETQKQTLSIQAPKVEFYDAVTGSNDTIDIGLVSKTLNMGIGRNRLFSLLRLKGILMSNNIPYQSFIDRGYFRVIETKYTKPDGSSHISIKTVVYQKGVDFIRKVILGAKNEMV